MEQASTKSRKQLSLIFYLLGAFGLILGGVQLVSFLSSWEGIALADAALNAGIGVLELFAGWFVMKGKKNAVFFLGAAILVSLVYGLVVGRGFNFVMLLVGGFFLARTIMLWQSGELS